MIRIAQLNALKKGGSQKKISSPLKAGCQSDSNASPLVNLMQDPFLKELSQKGDRVVHVHQYFNTYEVEEPNTAQPVVPQ